MGVEHELERDQRIEDLAAWLHENTRDLEHMVGGYEWPLHDNDDGYRGDGAYVRLIPKDIAEHHRDLARRVTEYFGNVPVGTATAAAAEVNGWRDEALEELPELAASVGMKFEALPTKGGLTRQDLELTKEMLDAVNQKLASNHMWIDEGLLTIIINAALSNSPSAKAAAKPELNYGWYAGDNDERYTIGPCGSSEEALQEAAGEDWDRVFIVEAAKEPVRLSRYFEVERLFDELAEDSDIGDPDGDAVEINASDEQAKELQALVRAAIDDWQARHKLVIDPWVFTHTRNAADFRRCAACEEWEKPEHSCSIEPAAAEGGAA